MNLTPQRCIAWVSLLLLLAANGCSTLSGPGSASFASVTIQGRTTQEIYAAATKVFGEDGYVGGRTDIGEMVFEKEASRGTSFAREGFVNTHYGASTINRVKAQVVRVSEGQYRLQCQAYMVTGGSDPFFQDEVPLANIRSRPYQSLLNKVEKELEPK